MDCLEQGHDRILFLNYRFNLGKKDLATIFGGGGEMPKLYSYVEVLGCYQYS